MGATYPILPVSRVTLQYYFNGVQGQLDTTDPLSQYDMDCLDATIGVAAFRLPRAAAPFQTPYACAELLFVSPHDLVLSWIDASAESTPLAIWLLLFHPEWVLCAICSSVQSLFAPDRGLCLKLLLPSFVRVGAL